MEKTRIVLVNGDKHFRRQIIWALEEDFELFEAGDRKTALRYLEEEKRPDIILMDLYLPPRPDFIEEGILLLNKAKEIAPEVKIVILTANGKSETIAKARELGTDDYIVMPFKVKDLRKALKEVISKPVPLGLERRKYWRDKDGKPREIENRKYWRVPSKLPISYSVVGAEPPVTGNSRTINISSGGLMFHALHLINKDRLLEIELSLPKPPSIKATGEVKWISKLENRNIYHLGIEFLQIRDKDTKRIADYIFKQPPWYNV